MSAEKKSLPELSPLKKRMLIGLSLLANKNGEGNYSNIFNLHKITKVPLAKINTLLNELHEEGAITFHPTNLDAKEAV